MALAETLRDGIAHLRLTVNCGGGSFKSQFKKADKSGAQYALLLGEDEMARGEIGIKSLRPTPLGEQSKAPAQHTIAQKDLINALLDIIEE